MPIDAGLIAWVEEALAPIGPVTHRAMMGGATLYCGGTVFAIVADDALWFKADPISDPAWDAAGAARFTYPRGDGVGTMNYRVRPTARMTTRTSCGAGRCWRWRRAAGRRRGSPAGARPDDHPSRPSASPSSCGSSPFALAAL